MANRVDNQVGSLERLNARDVFEHEAYNFTTWLEENVDSLSDVIGVDLATAEREKNVGDFSADLLIEQIVGIWI